MKPWAWTAAAIAGVAVVVLALRLPQDTVRRPTALPLSTTTVADGRIGGLLPDVTVRGRVRVDHVRDLRPGVLMLVRHDCRCITAVRQVVAAAARERLVTYLVESGDSLAQTELLAAEAGGDVGPYADASGTLAATYGLHSPAALVLVRRDGVVTQVVAAVGPSLRLATALRALVSG